MIFTALSMVLICFFGAMYDDFSRLVLSMVFAVGFMFVFEHYIYKGFNHFLLLSFASMIPYPIWMAFDEMIETHERYDIHALMKVLPIVAAITFVLEYLFGTFHNKQVVVGPEQRPRKVYRYERGRKRTAFRARG